MSMDYGIKVMESGANWTDTDIRKILMSSKYSMLKYHSDSTASLTLVPGDTDKYVEVSHNLGYVPAFIAYYKYQGVQYFIPSLPRSGGFSEYAYAWASSAVIRCGYAFTTGAYNQVNIQASFVDPDYWDDVFGVNTFILMGHNGSTSFSGAIRFQGVTVPQSATISSATLDVYAEYSNTSGSGDIKLDLWGIDEDNTGNFSGNPMGRSKTTAVTHRQGPPVPAGENFGIDVKSQVEEITTRGGWSSGNAMGFIYNDTGSASNRWVEDDAGTGSNSRLKITYGGNATVDFRVIIFKDKISD